MSRDRERGDKKIQSRFSREAKIAAIERFLAEEGYFLVRKSSHYDSESSIRLDADWLAFRVPRGDTKDWWIKPTRFCKGIGISQKTFIKKVKQPDCPDFFKYRGPKGRLVWLVPNQELITFLTRNKTG